MSASALQVVTLDAPDPRIDAFAVNHVERINSSISFTFIQRGDMTTLSTNSAEAGTSIAGFLYTPSLAAGNPCINASAPYIPQNATRLSNLPSVQRQNYPSIAIAPWLSPSCVTDYLDAAKTDNGLSAVVFFLVTPDAGMPAADDAVWSLGDGGQWKADHSFPVYAIPQTSASVILNEMALYSGNVSETPYAKNLSRVGVESTDYVRLYMEIDLPGSSGLPSIWVFLLIILAILLGVVGLISLSLHLIQRRRRQDLRARIAAGQVELEALGIKKLTVPQHLIDKMPSYTYTPTNAPEQAGGAVTAPATAAVAPHTAPEVSAVVAGRSSFYQPTCAICLEDFVGGETQVRELSCRHIFHPDCIDMVLRENSSLCPLCKVSTLPPGYCPAEVTNTMVRRERALHRPERNRAWVRPSHTRSSSAVELRNSSRPDTTGTAVYSADTTPPVSAPGRREWARSRALAMLGPHADTTDDVEHDRPASMPRKFFRRVFPGIG